MQCHLTLSTRRCQYHEYYIISTQPPDFWPCYPHINNNAQSSSTWYKAPTELMEMVVSSRVTGSARVAATTQQPHPPSQHMALVPVSPGCVPSQPRSVLEGSTSSSTTGALLRVKEMEASGERPTEVEESDLRAPGSSGSSLEPEATWVRPLPREGVLPMLIVLCK